MIKSRRIEKMKRPREAEFTVEVPIIVKFRASADLGEKRLLLEAKRQFNKAVRNKQYKVDTRRLEVVDKEYIYTKKEKEEADRFWDELFGDCEREQLKGGRK